MSELWCWKALPSGEVGVCRVVDLNATEEGQFAVFSDMHDAAGHVLDSDGTFENCIPIINGRLEP